MRAIKRLRLRYAATCECGIEISKGEFAGWDRSTRQTLCQNCLNSIPEPAASPEAAGIPGASLQREYERRVDAREARVLGRSPRIGRLLIKLSGPVRTTEAFAVGAEGERQVAQVLEKKLGEDALFLYNRRRGIGQTMGDIDMLVVVQSGVYIIDPKKYDGRKVRTNRASDTFIIDGRRRTSLATSMHKQIEVVSAAMRSGAGPSMPVDAAYCFVGADLPWRTFRVVGVPALNPRGVVKLLRQPGPFGPADRIEMQRFLHKQFPSA